MGQVVHSQIQLRSCLMRSIVTIKGPTFQNRTDISPNSRYLGPTKATIPHRDRKRFNPLSLILVFLQHQLLTARLLSRRLPLIAPNCLALLYLAQTTFKIFNIRQLLKTTKLVVVVVVGSWVLRASLNREQSQSTIVFQSRVIQYNLSSNNRSSSNFQTTVEQIHQLEIWLLRYLFLFIRRQQLPIFQWI